MVKAYALKSGAGRARGHTTPQIPGRLGAVSHVLRSCPPAHRIPVQHLAISYPEGAESR